MHRSGHCMGNQRLTRYARTADERQFANLSPDRTAGTIRRKMPPIMKALVLALLLATAASGSETGGSLFIHVFSGLEVLVDGVSAGLTSDNEGGRFVKNISPGAHKILIRSN